MTTRIVFVLRGALAIFVLITSVNTTAVRLVDGGHPWQGRVEVFHNNRWGTVCDDIFDKDDARVICAMLGYDRYGTVLAFGNAKFGAGTGPVIATDLKCLGSELDIADCNLRWFPSNCNHNEDAGVACSGNATSERIRLVGGQHPWEGRVEVYNNHHWGTICDDLFDINEARVICAMLGYDRYGNVVAFSNAEFGTGSDLIFMTDVKCAGTENDIAECNSRLFPDNCHHSEDAGVSCYGNATSDKVRLVGGKHPYEGRVEIYHNHQWGTVCDDKFGTEDARVICSMLGYDRNGPVVAFESAEFGEGNVPIMLTDLDCSGMEHDILHCNSRLFPDNCNHVEDAGVSCFGNTTNERVRLVGGEHHWEGRVEVYHNHQWGTVCDDDFDQNDATVVCAMLGYKSFGSEVAFSNAAFGKGTGLVLMTDLGCSGYEHDISHCSHRWSPSNCKHFEDAGVSCYGNSFTGNGVLDGNNTNSHGIRLIGSPYPWEGRVEVLNNHQWGTICDDHFDINDARVICAMLGYSRYGDIKVYHGATYGQGPGPIMIDDLDCLGTESDIRQCGSNKWYSHDCRHTQDAGVSCLTYHTTTTGVTIKPNGVEVSVNCQANHWNLSIPLLPLKQKYTDFKYTDIYLGDQSCTGNTSGDFLIFSDDYSSCKTEILETENSLLYKNSLVYAVHDSVHHFIVRDHRFSFNVECEIPTNGQIRNQTSASLSNAKVHLKFYSDSEYQHELKDSPPSYMIGKNVYVKAQTSFKNDGIKMHLEDCYTKPTQKSSDIYLYFIIRNGCALDPSAKITSHTAHETRFYFQDFAYENYPNGMYINCNATFCHKNDNSSACHSNCHPSKRKGIKLDSTNVGPIGFAESDANIRFIKGLNSLPVSATNAGRKGENKNSSGIVVGITVVAVSMLTVCVTIFVFLKRKRNQNGQPKII